MADLHDWPATPAITTAHLILEPLRTDHASEMAAALDDVALHVYIGGHPATAKELAARYARQVVGSSQDGAQRWCNWIIRQRADAGAVGYVQATIEAQDGLLVAELAWVLDRPAQGHGLAGEAATAMATWLRGRGVARLVAHVHPDHAASAAIARRVGLAATGVVVDSEVRWQA